MLQALTKLECPTVAPALIYLKIIYDDLLFKDFTFLLSLILLFCKYSYLFLSIKIKNLISYVYN